MSCFPWSRRLAPFLRVHAGCGVSCVPVGGVVRRCKFDWRWPSGDEFVAVIGRGRVASLPPYWMWGEFRPRTGGRMGSVLRLVRGCTLCILELLEWSITLLYYLELTRSCPFRALFVLFCHGALFCAPHRIN